MRFLKFIEPSLIQGNLSHTNARPSTKKVLLQPHTIFSYICSKAEGGHYQSMCNKTYNNYQRRQR